MIKLGLLVALTMSVAASSLDAAMAQQRPCMTTGSAGPLPPAVVQLCEEVKNRLVGTWTLVTYERAFQDGHKEPLIGAAPKGILMLDAAGNFTEIVARSDIQPFNDKMTIENARALIDGTKASFGYFWLGTGNNGISFEADFTSLDRGHVTTPASIAVLTADDFEYDIREPYGHYIHTVWKRVR